MVDHHSYSTRQGETADRTTHVNANLFWLHKCDPAGCGHYLVQSGRSA